MTPYTETKEKFFFEFDDFRVDPVRRVLLRDGEPVPITPKAMSILLVLLERSGEVVEKADLLERVWPGMVITEANLTQNVFSLRKSLGERANDTRYIQTVPGQGYTFGCEVIRVERSSTTSEIPIVISVEAAEDALAAEAVLPEPGPVEPPAPAVPDLPDLPPPLSRPRVRWRVPALTLGALFGLALAGVAIFGIVQIVQRLWEPSPAAKAGGVRQAVAVLDFHGLGPNRDLDWMGTALAEMLTTELAAGGKMRVIRGETVAQAMKSLKLRDSERLEREDLQKLHDALGADLVVVGSFTPVKERIRVDLRVLRLPEGDIKTSMAHVGTQPALFDLVARAGTDLREALGLEALSPEQAQQAQALRPGTPEAERLYLEGLARLRAFDPPGALSFLQRAAKADPNSAVIRTALSQAWSGLGYDARATEEARKAVELSASLSKEARLATKARFHQVSKDWEEASQTYRALWDALPDDVDYGLQLAECLLMGGHGTEAAAALAKLRQLPGPAGQDARIDLMEARNSRRLFDFVTQKRAAETAERKGRSSGQLLIISQASVYQGDALLQTGEPRQALALFQEAKALAEKAGYQWGVGQALANLAAARQTLGDLAGAETANRQALAIAEELGNAVGIAAQLNILGTLAQERGELDEALKLLDQSFERYVDLGDRVMQLRVLNSTGTVLTTRGDLVQARARFERALDLTYALSHQAYEARTLDNLATALAYQGRLKEARGHHEKAFAILSQLDDPGLASMAQYGAANAQARLGELAAAWERSGAALETKRRIGDRIGSARVLGLRAWIAWLRGDLAAARAIAEEKLRLAEQTGAKPQTACALQTLGRVAYSAGDLTEAQHHLEASLRTSLAVGEALRAAEVRLDLATLALATDNPGQAALLARESAAWFDARKIPGGDARASAVLAEALAIQGQSTQARTAANRARASLDLTEDRVLSLALAVRLARLEALQGRKAEAVRELRRASEGAAALGLTGIGLEARLALGEVQRSLGDAAAAAILEEVRRDAEARGFKRLAFLAGESVNNAMSMKVAR